MMQIKKSGNGNAGYVLLLQSQPYLQGVGQVSDDATLGGGLEDLGDLADDALDLVGDVDEVALGDGGVGVEDVVDAVDDLLMGE